MRTWILAACCAVAVLAFGPTPASALDACWPGCMFGSPTAAPPAKAASRKAAPTKAAQAKPKAVKTAYKATDEDRPQRRSRTASKGSGSSTSGGGGGASGIASFYWQPQRVAAGGWFNPNAMTAAHKTLPFGTRVRVTHAANGRSVDVTINDRGPYIAGRIIDLSKAAAGVIGMQGQGIANVRMTVLGR